MYCQICGEVDLKLTRVQDDLWACPYCVADDNVTGNTPIASEAPDDVDAIERERRNA